VSATPARSRQQRDRRWAPWATALLLAGALTACGTSGPENAGSGTSAQAATTPGATTPPGTAKRAGVPSPGCSAKTSGTNDPKAAQSLDVDGVARTYQIATPATTEPAPLVVLLHGMGSSGADISRVSDMPAKGTAAGMIIVTPDAQGSPTMWKPSGQGPDGMFLDKLITDVGNRHCVDTSRVGLAGFSVGAVFASAFACAHQDRIAAVVTVATDPPGQCTKPLHIMAFHGTADPVVPYAPPAGQQAMGGGSGTESNLAKWAEISKCATTPVTTEVGTEVTRFEWPKCADGSEVVLYKVIDGKHEWPGKDPATAMQPSTQQVSATDEALAFFGRHALGS